MSNDIHENIFIQRFVNNVKASALQNQDGSYQARRSQPVTTRLLNQHLHGNVTIGVYAVNPQDNTSRWLCFDSDEESEESFIKITHWLSSYNINSVRESKRPGRSGHLWVHFERSIPTVDAFRILFHGRFLYQFKGEIYPHTDTPLTCDKIGLLVRLPLGLHRKLLPTQRYGLFEACSSTNLQDQLEWFVSQPVAKISDINRLLSTLPVIKPVTTPVTVRRRSSKNSKSVLDMFPEDWGWIEINGEHRGGCPACILEGHDNHRDNLYVNVEKNVFHCFWSGGRHTYTQIRNAAQSFKNPV